jgi:hypothetical protein
MPMPGVGDGDLDDPRRPGQPHRDPAAELVNLTALLSRFQNTCCSRAASAVTLPANGSRSRTISMRLASAAGPTASSACGSPARPGSARLEVHRAGGDPRHVEQILDQLVLRHRVALDRRRWPGATCSGEMMSVWSSWRSRGWR